MAKNANYALPNRHAFVSAYTGGGKTQLIKLLVKRLSRVVFWDPDKDHKCTHYSDKQAFLIALKNVMEKGGRIGWNGEDDKDHMEWFFQCVWAALDGNKILTIVVEEAADADLKQTMPKWIGKTWRRCRKYGGVLVIGTQRIQEVPKSFITQAKDIYIGVQKANDQNYVKRQIGLSIEKMKLLEPLKFYLIEGNSTKLVSIPYVK